MVSFIAMTVAIDKLPDDPVALKAMLLDQQKKIKGLNDPASTPLAVKSTRATRTVQ